jgi:hypothetical protein
MSIVDVRDRVNASVAPAAANHHANHWSFAG